MISVKFSEKYKSKKKWTVGDFKLLPPEYCCEILNGTLSEPPSPGYSHQRKSRLLEFEIWGFVKRRKLGEVLDAPMDVILDAKNVVQPDIIFISKNRLSIIQEKGIVGAPDMVVEIISPSSVKTDRIEKMKLYEKFRIKEYWVVDQANHSLEVYTLKKNHYEILSFASGKGFVHSRVLPGFRLNIQKIFAALSF